MLVGVACQRAECFELSHGRKPCRNKPSRPLAPGFDCKGELDRPEQNERDGREQRVTLPVQEIDQESQPAYLPGSRMTFGFELRAQFLQTWRRELLPLQPLQHGGKQREIAPGALDRMFDTPHSGAHPEEKNKLERQCRL